jgi:hypothetical protein
VSDDPATSPPGRYRLGAEIARGGMGRVVEAEDTLLDRRVAIKQALDGDEDARRRFDREVRITARLEHPSIIPVYDAGRDGERGEHRYYVMRRVSGRPLDQVIAEATGDLARRLPLVPNLLAAADAVAHAHRRGVIHRDLKPANILLGEHGETLVIDWGLAKVLGEDDADDPYRSRVPPTAAVAAAAAAGSDAHATVLGTVIGTPGYMAPEQARADAVDRRTDVYALGACLYHLLAATPPYQGGTPTAVIEDTIAGPPRPIDAIVDGVPRELTTIVATAMAAEPAARYADAAALADDLRRFLAGKLVAAHHYTRRERLARFVRRHRAAVAVFVIATAAMIAGAVIAVRGILDERDRANAARTAADRARHAEADRADQMIVTKARALVATDPVAAIAALKQLPAGSRWWPNARGIALGAMAQGVAWGYRGHPGTSALRVSPDGMKIVSAGNDGRVSLIEPAIHSQRDLLPADPDAATDAVWIAGGTRVLASRWDHGVIDVDLAGVVRRTTAAEGGLRLIASSAGDVVAYYDSNMPGHGGLYDVATGALTELPLGLDHVRTATIDPHGRWIAFGGPGGVTVVDPRGAIIGRVTDAELGSADHDGPLSMEPTADGATLGVIINRPGAARLVEIAIGRASSVTRTVEIPVTAVFVMYSLLDVPIVVGMPDELLVFLDGRIDRRRIGGQLMGRSRAYGDTIAFAGNRMVVLMSRDSSRAMAAPEGGQLTTLTGSETSRYIAAAGEELILVWDLARTQPRVLAASQAGRIALFDDRTLLSANHPFGWSWLDLDTGATVPIAVDADAVMELWGYDVDTRRAIIGSHTGSEHFPVQLLRVGNGRTETLAESGAIYATLLSRDRYALGFNDGRIAVGTNAADRVEVANLHEPIASVVPTAGDRLVAASEHELVAIDLASGAVEHAPPPPEPVVVTSFDAAGRIIVFTERQALRWDGDHYTRLADLDRGPRSIARTTTGDLVVSARAGLFTIETATGEVRRMLDGDAAFQPVFDADATFAAGANGSAIDVVELATRERWTVPTTWRGPIAISPGGRRLAQISGERLLVWDFATPPPGELRAWLDTLTDAEPGAETAVRWPWQPP